MLPPAPTVTLNFSSRANMTSNAHMRFIFIWFLDIFFTYLRNTLESMQLKSLCEAQILLGDTLEHPYLIKPLAI